MRQRRLAVRCAVALRLVRDLGRLRAVVAGVRHEVLEDHLLQVAVLGVHGGERRERVDALLRRLADPTRMPLVNGIRSSPAARIVSSRTRGMLGRRALVDDEVGVHRLEHQPLRGGHLAQPRELARAKRADVRVRQHPALERALARPGDVAT